MINKGDIVRFKEFFYCNGSSQTIAFDSCGNPVFCELDCDLLVDKNEAVYIGSENIELNQTQSLSPPVNAKTATLQYKIPQGTSLNGNYNEVAYSTTDGSVPTYTNGRIFTHLGTEDLVLCQTQPWQAVPGPNGNALVNARYYA